MTQFVSNRKVVSLFIIGVICAVLLFFIWGQDSTYAVNNNLPSSYKLEAGAAKVEITPTQPVVLGGKGAGMSTGVHDDLYARTAVITWQDTVLILVSLDNCGIVSGDVEEIRRRIESGYGIDAVNLIVASTHTHNGPDMQGPYGGFSHEYTRDTYREKMINGVVESVGIAFELKEPAEVKIGSIMTEDMVFNRRTYPEEGVTDPELYVLQFNSLRGESIATIINFSVHPVPVVSSTLISADLPGYLTTKLEDEYGGIGLYTCGAIGNINPYPYFYYGENAPYGTPWEPDDPAQFEAAEEYADMLLGYTKLALSKGKDFTHLPLTVLKETVVLPLENQLYAWLIQNEQSKYSGHVIKEMFPLNDPEEPYVYGITTEVFVVKMGPIQFATMPGEFFVQSQLYLKSLMSRYGFVIGLAPETLGYIPSMDAFDPTRYEESLCVTSETGRMDGLLTDAIKRLLN